MTKKKHSAYFLLSLWLSAALFLLGCPGSSYAQIVESRDNHTNLWQNRSAWSQNWAGISTTENITDAEATVLGYVTNGLLEAPSSLSFTGAGGKLVVEDTLRVHGDLFMFNGSSLHIKPGGIVIVHGNYQQDANVNFINEGQAIFEKNWTSLGNSGAFSNPGNLYVKDTVTEGGITTSYKAFSTLLSENSLLHYFTFVKVISAVCAGNNQGTLTFTGEYKSIVRWESTHSFFRDDTTIIANQTTTQSYTNLIRTTSYRVYYETKPPMSRFENSNGGTVIMLEKTVGGSLSGPAEVCAAGNTGVISLSNSLGEVVRWESSTDEFQADVTVLAHVEESLTFNNLALATSYRAVVKNGSCNEAYSSIHTVKISPSPVGGSLSGSTEVCADVNSGSLSLSGYTGTILKWESSTDNFATSTTIASTSATLAYENLSQTTSYRAVVKNGVCNQAYSAMATVTVSPLSAGGTVNGSAEVCSGVHSGSLSLSGHTGDILRWESSTDNFITVTSIASVEPTLSYENLGQTTSYRAVLKSGVCEEAFSTAATINVSQVAGGTLAGEQTVCAGDNAGELQLSGWQGDILRWESSTDNFITIHPIVHTSSTYSFQNLTETKSFRAVIGNSVCEEVYSSEVQVHIQAPPSGGQLLGAATVCANDNNGSLQLESFEGSILRWERSTDNFATNIETIDQTTSTLVYKNLNQTTAYRVVVGSTSCREVYSETVAVQVEEASAGGVLAGGKRIKPGENEGLLELQHHVGAVIQWEVSTDNFSQDLQVLEHSNTSLPFQNLEVESWYRVLVQNSNCSAVYSEVARLWLNREPIALADTFWVMSGVNFTSTKSLLDNDHDPDGDALSLTYGQNQLTAGGNRLDIREDGTIYYEPQAGFLGVDSLQYRLCDVAGEASRCVEGRMYLLIEEEAPSEKELIIYQGVSPNGDGLNDAWVIEHIDQYPDNHVQLFDRYGVLVYEAKGYNNQEKIFDGKSNKGTVSGDGSLPDATYFYRIKLSIDQPALKGYVILNR